MKTRQPDSTPDLLPLATRTSLEQILRGTRFAAWSICFLYTAGVLIRIAGSPLAATSATACVLGAFVLAVSVDRLTRWNQ